MEDVRLETKQTNHGRHAARQGRVTSHRVAQDWGKYLGDNTMATTILDRLMHRVSTAIEN